MSDEIEYAHVIAKRGTAEEWALHDDVLLEGELGILVQTPPYADVVKVGDGYTPFSQLDAIAGDRGPQGLTGEPGPPGTPGGAEVITGTGIDPGLLDVVAGLVGANGRLTDLVLRADGSVPDNVIARWAPRLGNAGLLALLAGFSNGPAVAGFSGENGRQTDLVVDADGRVPLDQLLLWLQRMAPYLPTYAPGVPLAQSVYDSTVENGRGLLVPNNIGEYQAFISDSSRLAAWGDSLTEGWPRPPFASDLHDSWPGVFDASWVGTVYNGGGSGNSADEIAIRQGGYTLLLSVAGGAIPASGAVALTTTQTYGFRTDRSWACPGYLIGDDGTKVYGNLTRTGTSASSQFDASLARTFSFTRANPGNAVPVTGTTPFRSSPGESNKDAVQVLFAGRNDTGYNVPGTDVTKRMLAAFVAMKERPGAAHKRRLVLGTITNTGEPAGSAGYNLITAFNRQLAAWYPEDWFDLRAYLVTQAIYDQGITPTATDLSYMAKDTLPPSIMANYVVDGNGNATWDGTHYSVGTAAKVAAKLQAVLTSKGWIL